MKLGMNVYQSLQNEIVKIICLCYTCVLCKIDNFDLLPL